MGTQTPDKQIARTTKTLNEILGDAGTKARFNEILGKRGAGFISSILSAVKGNKSLSECSPASIVSAAAIAASLDLPISSALGAAAMVPYKEGGVPVAQFQIMRNGWVQLAQRTGAYALINATEAYEGELVSHNDFTGEYVFDREKRVKNAKIVGYAAYFKLNTGFEKYLYMTVEQITAHAKRFSKSFDRDIGMWKKDFHSMALKTVLKRLISKWGPVSIDSPLAKAIQVDQAVVDEQGKETYIDSTATTGDDEKSEETYADPKQKGAAPAAEKKAAPAKEAFPKAEFKVGRVGETKLGSVPVVKVVSEKGEEYYIESKDDQGGSRKAFFEKAQGDGVAVVVEFSDVAKRHYIVSESRAA